MLTDPGTRAARDPGDLAADGVGQHPGGGEGAGGRTLTDEDDRARGALEVGDDPVEVGRGVAAVGRDRRERGDTAGAPEGGQRVELVPRGGVEPAVGVLRERALVGAHGDDLGLVGTPRLADAEVQDRHLLLGIEADGEDHRGVLDVGVAGGVASAEGGQRLLLGRQPGGRVRQHLGDAVVRALGRSWRRRQEGGRRHQRVDRGDLRPPVIRCLYNDVARQHRADLPLPRPVLPAGVEPRRERLQRVVHDVILESQAAGYAGRSARGEVITELVHEHAGR